MGDHEFESQVTAFYQRPIILADADQFSEQLRRSIARRRLLRHLTLVPLGTLGAVLSFWAAIQTGLLAAMQRMLAAALELSGSDVSRWMTMSAVLILLSALIRAAISALENQSDNDDGTDVNKEPASEGRQKQPFLSTVANGFNA